MSIPKIRKAVFPVGGLGTRFLPATKAMPKEMLTLVDRPLIQHAVDEARAAGIEQCIFVTSRNKSALEDHFDTAPELRRTLESRGKSKELIQLDATEMESGQLIFTRQTQPLGLGHAVWCARHIVGNEPFAVLLPDDVVLSAAPCLAQMIGAYTETGGSYVAVTDVPRAQTARYGILDIAEEQGARVRVRGFVEKPAPEAAPSTLSIIGRYILQPGIFDLLERKQTGAGGEIQLTDSMHALAQQESFYGFRYEGARYDCGDKAGFITANVAFALAHPELGAAVRADIRKLTDAAR